MKREPLDLHRVERFAEEYARNRMRHWSRDLTAPTPTVWEIIADEIIDAYRAGYIHGRTT